jgi:ABC-2 type transport system ATP-binding protein
VLVSENSRKLAGRLVAWEDVDGIRILPGEKGVMVETRAPDQFYGRLPQLSLENGTAIKEVYSEDDNLEAVFKYLVTK